ncbi:MAG: 50S ribosomal protein L24, partial [Candidatus Wildermuthbacteria bacterium]|nr:50S ribosomal protein L24 [Candidatus Wildermuthbacteria bacterium]
MKIKKGDNVLVAAGKDKGKKGKVAKVFPQENMVLVEGVLIRKKNIRPKRQGEKGQTVLVPTPLHASNVELFCATCNTGVRAGYKIEG